MDNEKGAPTFPFTDLAKAPSVHVTSASPSPADEVYADPNGNFFKRWNSRIENLAGFEARGLARVQPHERQAYSIMGLVQMMLLWFSANMSINNLAVALCGPLIYSLGFVDSAWCAVGGIFLGALGTAYMSTWGAVSGNRTMVHTLYEQSATPTS